MRAVALLVFALLLTLCARASLIVSESRVKGGAGTTKIELQVPPRFMWGWGDGLRGYCGSFSFQSFALLFGNYISGQQIRNAADGKELLIGVNEHLAAANLKLKFEQWRWDREPTPQAKGFLGWAATHIDRGHGVVGGFYEQIDNGDEDYDHIMPITGYLRDDSVASASSGANTRSDVLAIYYHDLYQNATLVGNNDASFVKSRKGCGAPGGVEPKSPPYGFCLPNQYDYGIALMGNEDDNGELFPARLVMPSWTEPDYGNEDKLHKPIVRFQPTLYIEGLTVGSRYTVLRFDHPLDVPKANFAQGAYTRRFDIVASSSLMTLSGFDEFESSATIFYRVIRGL